MRYLGLNQIGHDQTNVALVVPSERAAHARGGMERFFPETLAEFPGVRERVEAGEVVRPILATGPFAVRSARVIAPGALLVGDAADFFDPATGDGIYCALRGAELVAETAAAALSQPGPVTVDRLAEYRRMRRPGVRGQVGGRAHDRLRAALPPAVRPGGITAGPS